LPNRRDLLLTKGAIKSQLELVDKRRVLWKNSSQEVVRLKAMLQAAEETEQQHRTHLTNAQQQTQKFKMKMQAIEKTIKVLQGGIGVNRVRRSSTKSLVQVALNRNVPVVSPVVPPSTPLKVKPFVFAKALARTSISLNRTVISSRLQNVDQLLSKSKEVVADPVPQKKTIHGENWLFGTLGDEWIKIHETNDFPAWTKSL